MLDKYEMRNRCRAAIKRINFRAYLNPAMGVFVHIDDRCVQEIGEAANEDDLFTLMGSIAQLAKGHIARLGGLTVGVSEMIVQKPVNVVYQVFKYNGKYYVTPETVIPFS